MKKLEIKWPNNHHHHQINELVCAFEKFVQQLCKQLVLLAASLGLGNGPIKKKKRRHQHLEQQRLMQQRLLVNCCFSSSSPWRSGRECSSRNSNHQNDHHYYDYEQFSRDSEAELWVLLLLLPLLLLGCVNECNKCKLCVDFVPIPLVGGCNWQSQLVSQLSFFFYLQSFMCCCRRRSASSTNGRLSEMVSDRHRLPGSFAAFSWLCALSRCWCCVIINQGAQIFRRPRRKQFFAFMVSTDCLFSVFRRYAIVVVESHFALLRIR